MGNFQQLLEDAHDLARAWWKFNGGCQTEPLVGASSNPSTSVRYCMREWSIRYEILFEILILINAPLSIYNLERAS